MDNSQQSPPAQAQPEPLMKCCQKASIRDCECLVPQGPCKVPEFIFTHYHHSCHCYSCEWIRETKKEYIPNRLGSASSTTKNPTWAGNQVDDVHDSHDSKASWYCTNIELVHPILVEEGQGRQRWGWVYHPTKEWILPFLAARYDCPKSVERVTLGSDGRWKAFHPNGTSFYIGVNAKIPRLNELYRDYDYHPKCSPYGPERPNDATLPPEKVNPTGYKPPPPPNKSRANAAAKENATLFIGGINKTVTDRDILELFTVFGTIRYMNRPNQTNAFVQFALRRDALMAMRQMQGVPVHSRRLRITWGNAQAKDQGEFPINNGTLPYKGNRHQQRQKPQQVQKRHENHMQGFNNMPRPCNHQQQYQMPQMAYAPSANVVWYRVPDQQHATQQQMGYGFQHMAQPPPPPQPAQLTAPRAPQMPQHAHTSRPFSFNPSAASWKGNLKGKGPVVVSSYMVPPPSLQSLSNSTSSSDWSQQANASTENFQSPLTSPEKPPSPETENNQQGDDDSGSVEK